jgi:hypothetical protein
MKLVRKKIQHSATIPRNTLASPTLYLTLSKTVDTLVQDLATLHAFEGSRDLIEGSRKHL